MNCEDARQIRRLFEAMIDLISVDEQIAQGKKKGTVVYGEYIDLKKRRTRLKHQIRNYISCIPED